jgi:hypothetical protein
MLRTLMLSASVVAASTALAGKLPAPSTVAKLRAENAELKAFAGIWTCAGTSRGAAGAATSYKAKMVLKWDLAGSWLAVHREVQRPSPFPAYAADGWLGWDAAGKRYWLVAVDGDGGWIDAGAPALQGPSLVLAGAGSVEGKRASLRYTFTPGKTEKDLLFAIETQQAGSSNWMLVAQDVCKR